MKYKIPLFTLLILFFCNIFFAQSSKIDSLKLELRQNKRNKFETANLLAWEYVNRSKDSLMYYNEFSKRHIVNDVEKGRYLVLRGAYCFLDGNYSRARKFINQSISFARQNHDYMTLGACYNVFSNIKHIEGDFHESSKYSKKAMNYSLRTNDKTIILKAIINYGSTLIQDNRYEEGIKYYKLGEKYFYEGGEYEKGVLYLNLGTAFSAQKDYKNAVIYLKRGSFFLRKSKAKRFYCNSWLELSEVYISTKNNKKSLFYLEKASKCAVSDYEVSNLNFLYAQYYKNTLELDRSRSYLQKSIAIDSITNQSKLGEDYVVMAELLTMSKNYTDAEKYLKKAVSIFTINNEEENLKSVYRLLIENFFLGGKSKEHWTYFNEYLKLSEKIDNISNDKALLDLDKKYKTAEKESKIKSQQIQIQRDRAIKYIVIGISALVLVLTGVGFIWSYNKQKRSELKLQNGILELHYEMSLMEMSLLNKQLDPHEIKNLLGAISDEIQEKAPSSYLRMVKLLDLIKSSLNSNSTTESIENQFRQSSDFVSLENCMLIIPIELSVEMNVDIKEFQLPRLLIKNLVENAMRHGLKHKKSAKTIRLVSEDVDEFVLIKVIDNGIWVEKEPETNSGIGITTYLKLFQLLNKKNKESAVISIDHDDFGTCISISIPKSYSWL